MSNKERFEKVKKTTTMTLSKITSKIEKASKISKLKLQNSNNNSKIYSIKAEIGDYIVANKDEFKEFPVIIEFLKEIEECKKSVDKNLKEIKNLD